VLNTPNGPRYTRDGHFSLNADKVLVNTQGFPVMGENGQIVLNGGRIEIGQDGSIFSDGTRVDSFLVVDYPAMTSLTPEAGSAVAGSVAPVPVANYALIQGGLETSNVNAVTEMTAMTSGYRIYEANAKAVGQIDNSLSQLIRATTE
jgi:flagellar basal-body rod protein FlgG